MEATATLAVIGAINVDLVSSGAALPGPGETITGGSFAQHHGGKGGNQAVAAARALGSGGRVVMIGSVGDDDLGTAGLHALEAEGVVTSVAVSDDAPTGVALIVVNDAGENQISVAPGANARVTSGQVQQNLGTHRPNLVLVSIEVPEEAVRSACEWCREAGATLLMNPAPVQPWVRSMLQFATYVTPNDGELRELGQLPDGVVVVETRGAGGVRIHGEPNVDVPAPRVDVVDTTGAGDCFNGVLAAGLLEGLDLEAAVRRAVVAASVSTTKAGAREGMPTRAQIDAALREPS